MGRREGAGKNKKASSPGIKERVKSLKESLINLFYTLRDAFNEARRRTGKFFKLKALITDEKYADDLKKLFKSLGILIGEIRPEKGGGYLEYGTGEPYSTAKAAEALAFIYPLYGEGIRVTPCMDKEILNADISINGKVRVFILLREVLGIALNKNLRMLYNKARNILDG